MSGLSTKLHINRRLRRVALILFSLWLTFAVVLGIAVTLYGFTDRAQPADVIIVLGAGVNVDGSPAPGQIRRAERGAALWKAGYAPVIICSGGFPGRASRSEGDSCAELLRVNGVPAEAIVLEERSRSTEENAVYSHEIMRANGWNSALVVSDGFHLLRATWIFSTEGMSFTTSPAAPPPLFEAIKSTAREVVALHWQLFKTILGLPYTFVPWV